jgi:hypothetical protein
MISLGSAERRVAERGSPSAERRVAERRGRGDRLLGNDVNDLAGRPSRKR